MRHRYYHHNRDFSRFRERRGFSHSREREHHPLVSIGLFFILLGIALLVATNDLLGLGSVGSYFLWDTILIFIGILLLLNLQFTGGLFLIALGVWFLKDRVFIISPEIFKTFYWPAVIVIVGLTFIISSFFQRKTKIDK